MVRIDVGPSDAKNAAEITDELEHLRAQYFGDKKEEELGYRSSDDEDLLAVIYNALPQDLTDYVERDLKDALPLKVKPVKFPAFVRFIRKINVIYEFFIAMLMYFTILFSTYVAFFKFFDIEVSFIQLITDFILSIDIIVRLGIEIWRLKSKCKYKVFLVNYTFFLALMDILALIPLQYIIMVSLKMEMLHFVQSIPYLRLNKILRLFRWMRFFDKLREDLRSNQRAIAVINHMLVYFLVMHFCTCFFFAICGKSYLDWLLHRVQDVDQAAEYSCYLRLRKTKSVPPDKYLHSYPTSAGIYIFTLEFITTILTSVGYGDIFPMNQTERYVSMAIMFIGSVWLTGQLSSTLTSFIIEQDGALYSLFFRREGISEHIADNFGSDFMDKQSKAYYNYLWCYREGIAQINLEGIPDCMQEDIMYDICEEMFYKSQLFRGLEDNFLHSLAMQTEIRLVIPGTHVIQQGASCQEMYYILQGEMGLMSEIDDDFTSIIYRSGCSVGEVNLFYSIPYEHSIYTRTVCQLLVLKKEDLLTKLQYNPHIYSIMRQRVSNRRRDLRNAHTLVHLHPLLKTVYRREDDEMKGVMKDIDLKEYPVVVRRSKGLNRIVKGDVILDHDQTYIVDHPCTNKKIAKTCAKAYREVSIPQIFNANSLFLKTWVFTSVIFRILMMLTTPSCIIVEVYSDPNSYYCKLMSSEFHVMIAINFVDLLIEVLSACPSTGIRFKIIDGFHKSKGEWTFYFDLVVLIPIELVYTNGWAVGMCKNILKMWKVLRVWSYLDQTFPLRLVYVRLFKILMILAYILYCGSIMLVWLICPNGKTGQCIDVTWFDKEWPDSRFKRVSTVGSLPEEAAFVAPFMFAIATVTSVGFGDISPQNTVEMAWLILLMVIGSFFTAYTVAELTSALSAVFRSQVKFNQTLQTIETFMSNQGLTERMTSRVVEHYKLNHEFRKCCILPDESSHIMFDAPKNLYEDILVAETALYLDGVPIFSKIDSRSIIRLAHSMKRFVIPPGITFVKRGEVRRQLYIIVKGWVGLYNYRDGQPAALYRSTSHFGLKDLLFGQPYQQNVKTLSHVLLFAIDYPIFESVFKEDEEFLRFIAGQEKERRSEILSLQAKNYTQEDRSDEGFIFLPSWIRYSSHPDEPILKGCTDFEDFERPFLHMSPWWSNLLRHVIMPRTVHPFGSFAKMWGVIISLSALLNVIFLFVETFVGYRSPILRFNQILVDIIFCADLYLRLHWGYEKFGMIWYHPVRTFLHHMFNGSFFIDVFMMFPAELFIFLIGATDFLGYGPGYAWYSKLRWIRLLRIYKFGELFAIIHRTYVNRSALFFLFYLFIAVINCVLLGAVACFVACPTFRHTWEEGDEFKLPACRVNSWIQIKFEDSKSLMKYASTPVTKPFDIEPSSMSTRWLLMINYIGQVMMVIGSGDLVSLNNNEMLFLLVVSIFGYVLMQCMVSDMTAAQVDTDAVRALCSEQLHRIGIVLRREGATSTFIMTVKAHFNLQWAYTKGLQARDLFFELHPALESDVFSEYVGDIFERVPVFKGISRSVIQTMSKYMKKEYFARGEMIARYGNMEYEIFVISGGEVYITDSQDKWICTVGIGESLGEMSLVYSVKRLYSAYAATTIEVFTLSAQEFGEVLSRFPSIKDAVLASLKRNKRDCFLVKAWKLKAKDPEKYDKEQKEKTAELASFIRPNDLVVDLKGFIKLKPGQKFTPELRFWKRFISYGEEDKIGHFYFYFASRRANKFNLVIHPNCIFMSQVRYFVTVIRYLLPCFALYSIFFYTGDDNDPETTITAQWILQILDLIYYFHILLKFFTASEIDQKKVYCKTWWRIVVHYLIVPKLFLLDLVTMFPYQWFFGNGTKLLLFRELLLVDYFNTLFDSRNDLGVSMFQYKLSISLSSVGLMAHTFACLFYWISCRQTRTSSCRPDSWIVRLKRDMKSDPLGVDTESPKPSFWYNVALYWVVTTITTSGMGDVSPVNAQEIVLSTLAVFVGAFTLSMILGNITTGLASLNQTEREFFYRWRIVINYLRGVGLSERGQNTLAAYITSRWNTCRGADYNEVLAVLPTCLRYDAYMALYHRCVTQCIFFGTNYDVGFVRNVCYRFQREMYLPGMKIANELEPSKGMYIVLRGCVTSYQFNPLTGVMDFKKRYQEYTAFGKIPALFPDALLNKSYRAEGKTEIVVISHAEIRRLIRSYPRWRCFLRGVIKVRYADFVQKTNFRSIVKTFKKTENDSKKIIITDFLQSKTIFTEYA